MDKPIMPTFITKHITFLHLHFLYFTTLSLLGAIVLSSHSTLSFIDSLYCSVSAVTMTGLVNVEMHQLSVVHKIALLVLLVLGSQVFTSLLPLFLRLYSANVQKRSGCSIPRSLYDNYLASVKVIDESNHEKALPSSRSLEAEQEDGVPCYEFAEHERRLSALFQKRNPETAALATVCSIVMLYFITAQIVGFIVCETFFLTNKEAMRVLKKSNNNPAFFSLFMSISAFANAGFTLIDKSMLPFQRSVGLLLTIGTLILLGNTMFPPCLRLIISVFHHFASGEKKLVYKYLLRNPRKCFTHLFSKKQTIWLVGTVMILNTLQSLCIYAFDWNSMAFNGLGDGYRLVDGAFQSITTRNAGMNVLNLSSLSPPTLLLMLGMMYVALYPVSITRQHSQEIEHSGDSKEHGLENSIYVLCRRLLARDSVCLFIATFLICATERRKMTEDPLNFSMFNMVFEIVSGYANVGLSMGYSCNLRGYEGERSCVEVDYSLSGKWTKGGQLLLIAVMMLGKIRGLPENIDVAIKLPIYKQSIEEEEELQSVKLHRKSESFKPAIEITSKNDVVESSKQISEQNDGEDHLAKCSNIVVIDEGEAPATGSMLLHENIPMKDNIQGPTFPSSPFTP